MRKLLLNCGFSPGDIVMLTAAVRDLHHWYPGQFVTDVQSACPDLWVNNPHVMPLSKDDPDIEIIDCTYPLINHANELPYHCLHGFIHFFNERLGLAIKPTAFKGDIHLSEQERVWHSQVREVTGENTPFWIVAAGGKYDVTIKWWQTERYQRVVDHFRERIQFVQVGNDGHYHPKLNGVIDLRGKTTLRELVRLVYHAQGVLCSITALMHLAAAVETVKGRPARRACVVVAGGREPAYWEEYPDHQFIHTNGALSCCQNGGCWKDRILPLRDGDPRDRRGSRCVNLVGQLPRCLDMITPETVIQRIETYFQGGILKYLSARQRTAAERGVKATARNQFDPHPLNLSGAGMACDAAAAALPDYPGGHERRGIVICGGAVTYFTSAWVCINMLRRLGCQLPIQLWYLGADEMDEERVALLRPLNVECVDAAKLWRKTFAKAIGGWELKAFALAHSRFREVLFLDADNVPVVNPEFLFDTPEFKTTGAVFWPDYDHGITPKTAIIWKSCGLRQPPEPEFESGQMVVDKSRCWPALKLALWFNENSDFYYQYLHGDKETFHLAFRKTKKSYSLVPTPVHGLEATMCQHDFQGRRIFQHRNMDKWDYLGHNRRVPGFQFEDECLAYVAQLRQIWDGGVARGVRNGVVKSAGSLWRIDSLKIKAVVIPGLNGKGDLERTLGNFAKTDWGGAPAGVPVREAGADPGAGSPVRWICSALERGLEGAPHYILILSGDLDFNRHLRHNLHDWEPVRTGRLEIASLYNPQVREIACDLPNRARIVRPNQAAGEHALLISRDIAKSMIRRGRRAGGEGGGLLSLATRLYQSVYYHAPSLVEHLGGPEAAGGSLPRARDFEPNWRA